MCIRDRFWSRLVGTAERSTSEMIEGQLRGVILTAIATTLGQSSVAFIDMAANQEAFSQKLAEAIGPALRAYGIDVKSFYVQSLSLPDELQRILDKVSSMNMLGDLNRYVQFQTAESIPIAAENPGGLAGAGAGLGAGLAIGQTMAQGFGTVSYTHLPMNIRVNSISPGTINTPMNDKLIKEIGGNLAKAWVKMHPLGRIGEPSEVAEAAIYLASDAAGFTTGTDLRVDGGLTAAPRYVPELL